MPKVELLIKKDKKAPEYYDKLFTDPLKSSCLGALHVSRAKVSYDSPTTCNNGNGLLSNEQLWASRCMSNGTELLSSYSISIAYKNKCLLVKEH